MLIININGAINAGKSTVGRLLARKQPQTLFVEVDDLLSDEEQDALKLDFMGGIKERLRRLDQLIETEKKRQRYQEIIFAYPMEENNYRRWKKFEDERTRFINITLSPSLQACLSNRGNRELTAWEQGRIQQMYQENYHCPQGSDFIVDNTNQTPDQTVEEIIKFLKRKAL